MHKNMKLFVSQEAYVMVPDKGPNLRVARPSGRLELTDTIPSLEDQEMTLEIDGIMGFIKLESAEYIIVIVNHEVEGRVRDHTISRITAFQILPIANANGLGDSKELEQKLFRLLESHIRENTFYFSYTYDLTHTLQRQADFTTEELAMPLWKRADERFFWNRFAMTKLINAQLDLDPFILPVTQGFAEFESATINDHPFVFGLISRRSRHRVGTRFFSRGIDEHGHVSNYVETEQLVIYNGSSSGASVQGKHQLSFVQTRGSIPIYWAQVSNLHYVPRLWIGENRKSLDAARAHFDEQIRIYGPQILVNLIDKKRYELPMGQNYARIVQMLNDDRIHYNHFDFHQECKHMRWDRIQLLVDELDERLQKMGYLHFDASDSERPAINKQVGVARTNCMDCLDRTGVVQSVLARYMLDRQLREVGILQAAESVQAHDAFMTIFRNVWANNADAISETYSGTGALKTDFTRTGKRTKAGALQDGRNSLVRYFKNNFFDGSRQDAMDLFLGVYQPDPNHFTNPFQSPKPLRVRAVPFILLFALYMLLLNLFNPGYAGFQSWTSYLLLLIFWASVIHVGIRFAFDHSDQFIGWPRLHPLPNIDTLDDDPPAKTT